MESTLNQFRGLLESYGGLMTMMIVLTILIVNIIKKPILKKAIEIAEKTGYDKSIVTRYVSVLPIVVMFVLLFIYNLITVGLEAIDWNELLSMSATYGAISIATYEVAKKQLQAYATKNKTISVPAYDEEKEDLRQTVIALQEMDKEKDQRIKTLQEDIKRSYTKDEVVDLRRQYEEVAIENNRLKEQQIIKDKTISNLKKSIELISQSKEITIPDKSFEIKLEEMEVKP